MGLPLEAARSKFSLPTLLRSFGRHPPLLRSVGWRALGESNPSCKIEKPAQSYSAQCFSLSNQPQAPQGNPMGYKRYV